VIQNQAPSDPRLVGLALVVRKYGTRVPGGAWEVFISDEDVRTMSPHGQLQQQRDQERGGVFLRYFPNATIEGEGTFSDPVTPEGVTPISVGGYTATGTLTPEGVKFAEDLLKEQDDRPVRSDEALG
jgi:hypothetical protein